MGSLIIQDRIYVLFRARWGAADDGSYSEIDRLVNGDKGLVSYTDIVIDVRSIARVNPAEEKDSITVDMDGASPVTLMINFHDMLNLLAELGITIHSAADLLKDARKIFKPKKQSTNEQY